MVQRTTDANKRLVMEIYCTECNLLASAALNLDELFPGAVDCNASRCNVPAACR